MATTAALPTSPLTSLPPTSSTPSLFYQAPSTRQILSPVASESHASAVSKKSLVPAVESSNHPASDVTDTPTSKLDTPPNYTRNDNFSDEDEELRPIVKGPARTYGRARVVTADSDDDNEMNTFKVTKSSRVVAAVPPSTTEEDDEEEEDFVPKASMRRKARISAAADSDDDDADGENTVTSKPTPRPTQSRRDESPQEVSTASESESDSGRGFTFEKKEKTATELISDTKNALIQSDSEDDGVEGDERVDMDMYGSAIERIRGRKTKGLTKGEMEDMNKESAAIKRSRDYQIERPEVEKKDLGGFLLGLSRGKKSVPSAPRSTFSGRSSLPPVARPLSSLPGSRLSHGFQHTSGPSLSISTPKGRPTILHQEASDPIQSTSPIDVSSSHAPNPSTYKIPPLETEQSVINITSSSQVEDSQSQSPSFGLSKSSNSKSPIRMKDRSTIGTYKSDESDDEDYPDDLMEVHNAQQAEEERLKKIKEDEQRKKSQLKATKLKLAEEAARKRALAPPVAQTSSKKASEDDDSDLEIEGAPVNSKKKINSTLSNKMQRLGVLPPPSSMREIEEATDSQLAHAGKSFGHADKRHRELIPSPMGKTNKPKYQPAVTLNQLNNNLLQRANEKSRLERQKKEEEYGNGRILPPREVINPAELAEKRKTQGLHTQEENSNHSGSCDDSEDDEFKPDGEDSDEEAEEGDENKGNEDGQVANAGAEGGEIDLDEAEASGSEKENIPPNGTPDVDEDKENSKPPPLFAGSRSALSSVMDLDEDEDQDTFGVISRSKKGKGRRSNRVILEDDEEEEQGGVTATEPSAPLQNLPVADYAPSPSESNINFDFGGDLDFGEGSEFGAGGGASQFFAQTQVSESASGFDFGGPLRPLSPAKKDGLIQPPATLFPSPVVSSTQAQKDIELMNQQMEDDVLYEEDEMLAGRRDARRYLNEQGFFTQTRPDFAKMAHDSQSSSAGRDPGSPTQVSQPRQSLFQPSHSSPQNTAEEDSELVEDNTEEDQEEEREGFEVPSSPEKDIQQSSSPEEPPAVRSAFEIMAEAARRDAMLKDKPIKKKNAFVADQADESDEEEAGFGGFGGTRGGDDEDEDDADREQVVADLVDDQEDSEENRALQDERARAKARADEDAADEARLKAAEAVTKGEMRTKRKGGFDDLESDSEDENFGNSRRHKKKKKRRGKNALDQFAENPETQAFASVFLQEDIDLVDETLLSEEEKEESDDEDIVPDNVIDGEADSISGGEETQKQETITTTTLRDQLRQIGRQNKLKESEPQEIRDSPEPMDAEPEPLRIYDDVSDDELEETQINVKKRRTTDPIMEAIPEDLLTTSWMSRSSSSSHMELEKQQRAKKFIEDESQSNTDSIHKSGKASVTGFARKTSSTMSLKSERKTSLSSTGTSSSSSIRGGLSGIKKNWTS